jgi:heptaprenyl diphosphate synthase
VSGSLQRLSRIALLVAVATTLQIAENLIPKPLPWLRLGLANGVTLLAIVRLGFGTSLAITVVRIVLGGLLLGTIGGPTFVLSAAGGCLAALVMGLAAKSLGRWLSLLGISVLGSVAHVVGQLAALGLLLGAGAGPMTFLPVFILGAVPMGIVTGAVILAVHRRLPSW